MGRKSPRTHPTTHISGRPESNFQKYLNRISARGHASTLAGALISVTSIHKLVFRLHNVSVIYDIFLEYRSVSKGNCHGYG